MKTILPLLFLTTLAGCDAITPAGLMAAARLDPLTTAPEHVALAVTVPDTVRLRSGDAVLSLAFRAEGADMPAVSETVPLMIAPATTASPGTRRYVARIAPADAPRLVAAQTAIRALRASGTMGAGSLGVSVERGCTTAPLGRSLPISTAIRTDPEAPFVPLTRSVDAFDRLSPAEAAALRARFAPCDAS
ncbi:hypothetical protein ACK8OR_05695 [Jannaschia sp. KMU-145]|uniref:hypothetical protein n=1 Tax=Jannaschia halovivens TaxID=3388667 RepID=UPI00396B2B0C